MKRNADWVVLGRRGKFELIERLFPLSVLYISRLLHQATAAILPC
jgi:hypothetical protein